MAQVFCCKYCEIFKNTCFIEHLRWLPLGKIRTNSLNSAKFQFQLFLTKFDIMGYLYIVT